MPTKSHKPAPEKGKPVTPETTSLVGRLTADPMLRRTATGTAVTTIRIAVNGTDEPTFHPVVVWGKTARAVCQYLKKGRLVEVIGRSQQRTYTDSSGTEQTVTEIVARQVQFLSRPPADVESGAVA